MIVLLGVRYDENVAPEEGEKGGGFGAMVVCLGGLGVYAVDGRGMSKGFWILLQ